VDNVLTFGEIMFHIAKGVTILFIGLAVAAFITIPVLGQTQSGEKNGWRNRAPRVFLDGSGVGSDYVRTEIPFVNYVWDQKSADIHILTTALSSGSGTEYQIEFIGLGKYKDIHFTLVYFADRLATYDEYRAGYVRILKKGLMPFASRTPVEDMLSISFKEKAAPLPMKDPWKGWIFGLNLSGSMSGEETYKSSSFRGGFSINRVTVDLKINISYSRSIYKSRFTILDEHIDTTTKSSRFNSLIVRSISPHWSVGGWMTASSSTYSNEDFTIGIAPALEFDVFPYSQATRKRLCILYRLRWGHYHYLEETIYGKMIDSLWSQSLMASLEVTQPWGSASASIVGSHYLHDLSKNRLSLYGGISVRIWKGFSVYWNGNFEMIHDQLSLVKGSLSEEEIFLRLKQLSTTYDYYLSIGISYSFGSSLSKAVNPRFSDFGYY
jgi:hypothetical protein